MSYIKGNLNENIVTQMIEVLRDEVMHVTELGRRIGRSESWVRFAAEHLVDKGRAAELANLRSYRRGTKDAVPFADNLEAHRRGRVVVKPTGRCRHCDLRGQMAGQSNGKCRTICDSCSVDSDMRHNNPDHTRTWRSDRRWIAIMAEKHQERDGCLICGSLRAKLRDGRYCDWRHDPVMLTPEEFDALLERHSSVTRYDVWGNVLR